MKKIIILLISLNTFFAFAKEYHVSVKGNDNNDGSFKKPLKTIMAAANKAMPGDIITVHEGIYREKIAPPRGGTSKEKCITYQAAPGEKVVITGSESVKGWEKVESDTWKLTLSNSFFGTNNPFEEQLYGSWYMGNGKPNHTGSVYLNGKRIRETFSLYDVFKPTGDQPYFYTEADGNGGPVLMNIEWVHPAGGKQMTYADSSVEGGDQAVVLPGDHFPFGYLKDGSILHFDAVDFGSGTDILFFNAATLAKGGTVEVHLGNPSGELLGSSVVTNTGDWTKFSPFNIKLLRKLSGKQNICLVIRAPKLNSDGKTTIWAQFPNGINPNTESVEISVRPQVFYPEKTGINYITVRGFILENAATNWAPPSAEQPGLIGTRWGKGWVIENNIIRNSRCSGISLGRSTFGHAHHYQKLPPRVYPEPNAGQTEKQLIDYFENASWTKDETGFHTIRNNQIYECGQAGIVGCSGGAFSLIEGNDIHDICIGEIFSGWEQAGIKLHFAMDAVIRNNHIYRTIRGIWLDWGAQGVQVVGNLFHDNGSAKGMFENDVFLEVNHGPLLMANNIFLSEQAIYQKSQGVANVHNLISGTVAGGKDARKTYYYKPHETVSLGKTLNVGGNWSWYNNLIINKASFKKWDEPKLPINYDGNVYTKETQRDSNDTTAIFDSNFDSDVKLIHKADGWYLSMHVSSDWVNKSKRKLVTTQVLDKATIPNQEFTNPDGSPVKIDYDYFSHKRNVNNPFPGPIEFGNIGMQEIKVWPK
ncbi:carbohydrate-binding protein [Flavobacterium gilvum]|uniref:Cellulose binding type IV domain-containing protein n=1 Tax=Flavobacterium gilvum TaxID=1492737 RepID=A0AAC9N686_9FLAO|nr:carbohydrate-binding protein [Flavobacterium gilvum]AOW08578.1 hypothetical protein EM308_03185 [Flavobacterium gilvum]KFC58431.1 hypothetical protein FEM08_28000 [Flavobacterium gilvum]